VGFTLTTSGFSPLKPLCYGGSLHGLTENAGHENDGPSKLQGMKLQDVKLQDVKLQA